MRVQVPPSAPISYRLHVLPSYVVIPDIFNRESILFLLANNRWSVEPLTIGARMQRSKQFFVMPGFAPAAEILFFSGKGAVFLQTEQIQSA